MSEAARRFGDLAGNLATDGRDGNRADDLRRLPGRFALGLRVLVLLGYPFVGILTALFNVPSTTLSLPYRAFVVGLSLAVIGSHLRRPFRGALDATLASFWLIYALRLIYDWQIAGIEGAENALIFFSAVVILPVWAVLLAGADLVEDRNFARLLLFAGLVFVGLTLVAMSLGRSYNPWEQQGVESTRLWFEALNPISLGHAGGITLIAGLYSWMETRNGVLMRGLIGAAIFGGAFVLLAANSRGPMIAVGLALAWLLSARFKRLAYAIPIAIVSLYFIESERELVSRMLERFSTDVSVDGSTIARLNDQRAALEAFYDNPIIGAFYLDPRLGVGNYPHNIVIEVAMALGVVGLALLLILMLKVMWRIFNGYGRAHPLLTTLLIQQLVATQFSGAIWGVDGYFMLVGLTLIARPGRASGRGTSAPLPANDLRRSLRSLPPESRAP